MKTRDIPIEHFIFASIVLSVLTWFTATALLRGEISIGRTGFSNIISKESNPNGYWESTGAFIVITSLGWGALALNLFRKFKQTRKRK